MMQGSRGLKRLDADGWTALVLLGLCAVFLSELLGTEATGAFVTSTTMPKAIVLVIGGLALLLLAGSVLRALRSVPRVPKTETGQSSRINWKMPLMVVWLIVYTAALPVIGYLASSALFMVGAGLLYGNRRWAVLLSWAVVLPVALLLFFEKVMIVLLPASSFWG